MPKGIALIQVLIISAIISVFALYLSRTALSQVETAQQLQDKNQALISLYDTEALLTHHLLSFPRVKNEASQNINNQWNFFNQEFQISDETVIAIQDNAGLINMQFPDVNLFRKWMTCQQEDENTAQIILDSLADWQDNDDFRRIDGAESDFYASSGYQPRNNAILLQDEVAMIRGVSAELANALIPNTAIFVPSYFNPLNAPNNLMACLYDPRVSEELLQLRAQHGHVELSKFKELTGEIESEGLMFFTSNILTITLTSSIGDARVGKQIVVKLDPYATFQQPALEVFNTKWR